MRRARLVVALLAAAPLAALPGCGASDEIFAPGAGPIESRALEAHLAHTPRDGRAWVLLARTRLAADQFEAAAQAYEQALAVSRTVARDPQIWCELADALGMAQGGSLKGRPQQLIDTALGLDGRHPRALEMAGSAAFEARDFARALFYWESLLQQLGPRSAEHRELQAAIERLRRLAERPPERG